MPISQHKSRHNLNTANGQIFFRQISDTKRTLITILEIYDEVSYTCTNLVTKNLVIIGCNSAVKSDAPLEILYLKAISNSIIVAQLDLGQNGL
jgi:hypothetical protein